MSQREHHHGPNKLNHLKNYEHCGKKHSSMLT
jgi:hypothetical protein